MSHYCPGCNEKHNGYGDVCDACAAEMQANQDAAQQQAEAEAQAYEQQQADQAQAEAEQQYDPGPQGGPEG